MKIKSVICMGLIITSTLFVSKSWTATQAATKVGKTVFEKIVRGAKWTAGIGGSAAIADVAYDANQQGWFDWMKGKTAEAGKQVVEKAKEEVAPAAGKILVDKEQLAQVVAENTALKNPSTLSDTSLRKAASDFGNGVTSFFAKLAEYQDWILDVNQWKPAIDEKTKEFLKDEKGGIKMIPNIEKINAKNFLPIHTIRRPFQFVKNNAVFTSIMGAAIMYYLYRRAATYQKAGQGIAKDIEAGINKANTTKGIPTGQMGDVHATIKLNRDLINDLYTIGAPLYDKMALPSR